MFDGEIRPPLSAQPELGAIDTVRNWAWAARTALASGDAAIMATQGAQHGNRWALLTGISILLGSSEMTDYPRRKHAAGPNRTFSEIGRAVHNEYASFCI